MHQERRTMPRRKTKVSKKFALLMAAMPPRGQQQQPFVLLSFSHEMVSLLFHFMMAFSKKEEERKNCSDRSSVSLPAAYEDSRRSSKSLILSQNLQYWISVAIDENQP